MDGRKALFWNAAAATLIGMDYASRHDETARWSPPKKSKAPDPHKRAKVKAARKQRHKK